jgi:NADH-quinone oxidoreductase subunit N
MYIKQTDTPLPTFKSEETTKIALAVCTAGIVLFGICSCIYDYLFAASVF